MRVGVNYGNGIVGVIAGANLLDGSEVGQGGHSFAGLVRGKSIHAN